ncbi:hypothetical protein SAMN04488696_0998 [Methanolobus profundi]|uniref:Uncharacterized protein n=1 Tax=Methanolobus profundi TaxID=487685 RepID=A0A1I4PZE8_9EURY|nr:hypothetical protein SAMN04488696_0998 [Methanolobus profundi]
MPLPYLYLIAAVLVMLGTTFYFILRRDNA